MDIGMLGRRLAPTTSSNLLLPHLPASSISRPKWLAVLLGGALGVAFAGLAFASAARAGEPRALLELFTSQGCSSCPPADKLLGDLAEDPSLVVLSVPIDYWDYLGWKDTLASPAHSARQRAYAHVRGDRQVYTPQIVVNGTVHVLGSDEAAIDRAIAQTDQKPGVMSAPVLISIGGNNVNVKVNSALTGHPAGEVWLCPLQKAVAVSIGRGENHGRTVTYHNVVRSWVKLGDWSGSAASWTIPLAQIEDGGIDAAAVMVQEGTHDRPGMILGAASASLH
jgi:hypothetical protein